MPSSSPSSGPDLSNLPVDILSEIIMKRLEVLDFIRSGAVCTTWRNLPCRKYGRKTQIPWLMFSSSEEKADDDDDHWYFYYSMTEKKKQEIYIPDIGGRRFVGSSQGFLISIDDVADLHATNPITGTHISLPPTSTSPGIKGVVTDPETGQITHHIQKPRRGLKLGVHYFPTPVSNSRDQHYEKVILSPSADIAVAIYGIGRLAYARIPRDDKWTVLRVPGYPMDVYDATFHKGTLHAITGIGTLAIFDDLDTGRPSFVSPGGPLDWVENAFPKRYLVESPDGKDLFLIYREMDEEHCFPFTKNMIVFLLDKTTYSWKQTISLGDVALFLGFNHSMSLCTTREEYLGLKRNSVYFTDDNKLAHKNEPKDMGVLNLEDGSIEPLYVDSDLDRFGWPQPTWFMPILS